MMSYIPKILSALYNSGSHSAFITASQPGTDPDIASVKLLLNSVTDVLADNEITPKNVTCPFGINVPVLDNGELLFGKPMSYYNGGTGLLIPITGDWVPTGTSNYTFEFFIKRPTGQQLYSRIFEYASNMSMFLVYNELDDKIGIMFNGVQGLTSLPMDDGLHFIKIVRDGVNSTKLFVDNVQQGSTYTANYSLPITGNFFNIGYYYGGAAQYNFIGHLGEIRFSTVVRDTTIPTEPFLGADAVPDTIISTDWQLAFDQACTSIYEESPNDMFNLYTINAPYLADNVVYYGRLRQTTASGTSDWSPGFLIVNSAVRSPLDIQRVQVLPDPVAANTLYIVRGSTSEEAVLYFTGHSNTEVRHNLTHSEVTGLISDAIVGAESIKKVTTILDRNNASYSLTQNALFLVTNPQDNTGGFADSTVTAGAALYFFDQSSNSFTKVAEFESMDVTVAWSAISGKPSSSVADIDDAVAKKHAHANLTDLDSLTSLACAEANKLDHDAQNELTYNSGNKRTYVVNQDW